MIFTDLEALVPFARRRAQRGLYDGRMTEQTMALMRGCSHVLRFSPGLEATVLYTRDVGHHTSGWWKNPDYERCLHLSLAYRHPMLPGARLPQEHARSEVIARAFFGDNARLAWVERPFSPEGKAADVWHYRVFCDPAWAPIMPRGEVYSRDWTPADWRSFSEVHGTPLSEVDVPFLLGASS